MWLVKKIKKGVIAVAGLTSRFLPASKGCPKGLLPVLSKPVIHYLVEEMIGAGLDQICIVHSHGDPRVKRYFTPDPELQKSLQKSGKLHLIEDLQNIQKKVKFKFIPQPRTRLPYGNGTPILAAKSFIGSDPFVYAFGDDLIIEKEPGAYLKHLLDIFEKYQPAAVVAAQEVPWKEISLYGSIQYQRDKKYPNRASRIMEKVPAEKAPSNITQIGRFVYSPGVIKVLQDLTPAKKGGQVAELWLADANNLLAEKEVLIAEPIKKGFWITTGDPLRWLKANLLLAFRDEKMRREIGQFLKERGMKYPSRE